MHMFSMRKDFWCMTNTFGLLIGSIAFIRTFAEYLYIWKTAISAAAVSFCDGITIVKELCGTKSVIGKVSTIQRSCVRLRGSSVYFLDEVFDRVNTVQCHRREFNINIYRHERVRTFNSAINRNKLHCSVQQWVRSRNDIASERIFRP